MASLVECIEHGRDAGYRRIVDTWHTYDPPFLVPLISSTSGSIAWKLLATSDTIRLRACTTSVLGQLRRSWKPGWHEKANFGALVAVVQAATR
jgi:hypothetical protein